MPWHDSAADLPAPRDDEPAHLRQDILDELADHLQSALERELHQTPNQAEARQQVLTRFGDPRVVARKLWFDAMWEKVMSQRIQLATSVLMLLVCIAFVAMMWISAQQARAMNEALITQLQKLSHQQAPAPPPSPVDPEWNRVRVQLVTESGEPLPKGFAVTLERQKEFQYTDQPAAEGRADFGLVRPGYCELRITSPWGQRCEQQFSVRAGVPTDRRVVCPSPPAKGLQGRFEVEWPEEFDASEVWLACEFAPHSQLINGIEWQMPQPPKFLLNPRGEIIPMDGRGFESPGGVFFDIEGALTLASEHGFGSGGAALSRSTQTLQGEDHPQETVRVPANQVSPLRIVPFLAALPQKGSPRVFARLAPKMASIPLMASPDGSICNWKLPIPESMVKEIRRTLATDDGSIPRPWNGYEFKLIGESSSPPPVGFEVFLLDPKGETIASGTADATGLLKFGQLAKPPHAMKVHSPWGEEFFTLVRPISRQQFPPNPQPTLMLRHDQTYILCPTEAPPEIEGKFKVEWPVEVRSQKLWLIGRADRGRLTGNNLWKPIQSASCYVLISPDGEQFEFSSDDPSAIATLDKSPDSDVPGTISLRLPAEPFVANHAPPYRLYEIAVLREMQPAVTGQGQRPDADDNREPRPVSFERVAGPVMLNMQFNPTPGKLNVWKLPIQAGLKAQIEEKLSAMNQSYSDRKSGGKID